ncbi:hypothetical protein [Pseudacidovorax intermedius]|uniref:hypothetical protein n=1 Tax=Pseudacidovorax intermedius TaxID=433924 RepID=UPI0026EB0381|nr:hypothetical protein [Pseudacidovorax intermedius]
MNDDLPRLIEALRHALQRSVAPELQSDFARGQLAAVHDILGKLAGMAVWDPAARSAQAEALRTGLARFEARAVQAGQRLPAVPGRPDADELAAAEARMRARVDWLDASADDLGAALHAELDAIVRQALREQLLVERKRIPLTDFGAMTAAASSAPKD